MKMVENNALFWQKLDTLVMSNVIEIEKKAGESHDELKSLIYPVDLGQISDTLGIGNHTLEIYRGKKLSGKGIQAIAVSCNILDKTVEVKLIVDCDEEEIQSIITFLNSMDFQKALLIRRGSEIPEWDED